MQTACLQILIQFTLFCIAFDNLICLHFSGKSYVFVQVTSPTVFPTSPLHHTLLANVTAASPQNNHRNFLKDLGTHAQLDQRQQVGHIFLISAEHGHFTRRFRQAQTAKRRQTFRHFGFFFSTRAKTHENFTRAAARKHLLLPSCQTRMRGKTENGSRVNTRCTVCGGYSFGGLNFSVLNFGVHCC